MVGLWSLPNPKLSMLDLFSRASDFESIARALRHCGRARAIAPGESFHSLLIKLGICNDDFIANNLIGMYSDLELYDRAQKLFVEMPVKNVVSWTASILAHIRAGDPFEALKVFSEMNDFGLVKPNGFTFAVALKACALAGDIKYGRWIHEQILRAGLQFDTVLMNTVIDMYVKCQKLDEARMVFDAIFPGNFTSWNTMIAGYCKEGKMVEAEDMFHQVPEHDAVTFNSMIAGFGLIESSKALDYIHWMHKLGFKLDHFTFPCAVKVCGILRFETMGEQIHCYITKCGFKTSRYVGPAVVNMYAKCERQNDAKKSFEEYLQVLPFLDRLPLFNALLSGYANNGCESSALSLISEIFRLGIGMDAYTLSSALKVCISLRSLRIGMQVHNLIVTNGYHLDCIVGSVLVDLYAKQGRLVEALRIFDAFPHLDVVAWAGLINGCVQQGSYQLAFSLFRRMMISGIRYDQFVVSVIIKACSLLTAIQGGKQVHALCIKSSFDLDIGVLASLVDMYSKCGDIDDGLLVFKSAKKKDAVMWSGMIVGCGNNGRATEAIKFFKKMLNSGEKPNAITYLGVLSACRHAGMVSEACKLFIEMKDKHGVVPSLEHYRCMVDILCRDGKFDEAKYLISGTPYAADETVVNSLLGASMINQNAHLGNFASSDLLKNSLVDTSQYVTLSNVYANLGMWDGSAKLREMIRSVGMKDAGRSSLEARAA